MHSNEILNRRKPGLAGPLALLLILVALVWAAGARMMRLEYSFYDLFQQQQTSTATSRILVVDASTPDASRSLWDDPRLPGLIEKLDAAGAIIVPTEPPPASTPMPDLRQLAKLLKLEQQRARRNDQDVTALSSQLAAFRKQFENRANSESAIAKARNVVLALAPMNHTTAEFMLECESLAATGQAGTLATIPPAREYLGLPATLCGKTERAGYASFRPDPDGIVRESSLLVRSGDRAVPTLALATLAASLGNAPIGAENRHIVIGEHSLNTHSGFGILHRYYHQETGQASFETVALDALLNDEGMANGLDGRIVLIGRLAHETTYRTPVDRAMPGTLLVATSLSNLLQGDYLLRPGWLPWAELALLIALSVLLLLLTPELSLNAAAAAVIFLVTILIAIEALLLLGLGIWTRLVTPATFCTLGIAALYSISVLRSQARSMAVATPVPAMGRLTDEDELDMAFSVLRQQSPTDDTKERLYRIAVTHGKRKEFAKAERVLRYLASIDPDYRGVQDKLRKLSGARNKAPDRKPSTAAEAPAPKPVTSDPATDTGGIGRRLGRYELQEKLGQGAMATVYLAIDPKINRKVAIKTIALAEEFSEEDLQSAKEQFLREAESAGRLNHPNIIVIYDVGEDDNVAYLAMEYFEGKSLSQYAQPGKLLPPRWVLELGARAADALHYAHSQNVVHRDIKPANIMYHAATDDLKLTDFGIARLTDTSRTKTGIILGTPSYMSPEQLSGAAVTGQSDLYSLGITLYHLLTGAPPFRADSIPKLMDKIVNDRHASLTNTRDDLPACVDELFDCILAKDPADRYANGRAMALALRDCCSSFDG